MAFATSPKPVPPYREPKALIVRFYRELLALLRAQSRMMAAELLTSRWQAVTEAVRARLGVRDSIDPANGAAYRRADDEFDDLEDAIERMKVQISRDQPDVLLEDIITRYGEEVNAHTMATFRRQFKAALGIDLIGGSPRAGDILKAYVRDNVSLIKTIRQEKFDRVQALVERNWRVGARWENIAASIKDEFGHDDFKAMRIARDQVGKLNAELSRDRQISAGVERFVWRTSKDGRVRELHRRLEGKIFEWSRGHPTEGIPGWAIQCRCYGEPVFVDPDTGRPEGPMGEEPDVRPFPSEIGYARTSGGRQVRPRRGPGPPAPKLGGGTPAPAAAAPATPASAPRAPRRTRGTRAAPVAPARPARAPRATRAAVPPPAPEPPAAPKPKRPKRERARRAPGPPVGDILPPEPILEAKHIRTRFKRGADAMLRELFPDLPLARARAEVVRLLGIDVGTVVSGTIDVIPGTSKTKVTIEGDFRLTLGAKATIHRNVLLDTKTGRPTQYNAYFEIEKRDDDDHPGLGTEFLLRTVEASHRLGISTMTAFAARGPHFNGFYTWPRLGYNGPFPEHLRARLQATDLPSEAKQAKTFHEFMTFEAARQWWKKNGVGVDLEFDPSPGSAHRRWLVAYREEQRKKRKG